jgi:hypothetical protein
MTRFTGQAAGATAGGGTNTPGNARVIEEPPASPALQSTENPSFEVELSNLESGGSKKAPAEMSSSGTTSPNSPTRRRSFLGSFLDKPVALGEDDTTLSEAEKIAVRHKSMLVENMRKQKENQRLYKIEHNFIAHDTKPWHRRFYCSDLCRKQTQELLDDADSGVFAAIYGWMLVITILLSYFMAITETIRDTDAEGAPFNRKNLRPNRYLIAQVIFITIFTLDTSARFLVADNWFRMSKDEGTIYHGRMYKNTRPFFLIFWNWIDVLSILLVFIFGFSASFFIVLRVFRPVRNLSQFRIISETLTTSARLLSITTFFLGSVMVLVAMVTLSLESCYNVNCQFADGFNTLYFIVITMTSVGFGDQIPTTMPARLMAVIAMIIGSFYLAMPLAIIGDKFDRAWAEYQYKESLKRTEAENKILRDIEESQVTSEHRKRRVIVHSYQALDAMGSSLAHMRNLQNGEKNSKRSLLRSFSRLFAICGLMVEDLMIIYPTYKTKPQFVMENPHARSKESGQRGPDTASESSSKRNGKKNRPSLFKRARSIKYITQKGHDETTLEEGNEPELVHAEKVSASAAAAQKSRATSPLPEKPESLPNAVSATQEKLLHKDAPSNDSGNRTDRQTRRASRDRSMSQILKSKAKSFSQAPGHMFDAVLDGVNFFRSVKSTKSSHNRKRVDVGHHRGNSGGPMRRTPSIMKSIVAGSTEPATYDGIPLLGSYWERQFDSRRTARARDIEIIQEAKKAGALGRWVQLKQYCLGACSAVSACLCKENDVNEEDVAFHAQVNKHWRSQLWLLMESPESSRAAFIVRIVRLIMTSLALMLVLAESMPEMNNYGQHSRPCKNVINWYCEWVTTCHDSRDVFGMSSCENTWSSEVYTQADINALNPGCFKNVTLGYGGCLGEMDGEYSQCDFPNAKAGMTMDNAEEIFGERFINYLGKRGESKYRMADRLQCTNTEEFVKNENGFFKAAPETFFVFEVLFVIIFAFELTLRLIAATAPKDLDWGDWFSTFANWVDLLSVATALLEIIANAAMFGAAKYQVWGWMGMTNGPDPATFRVLRVVVAVRFMLQQRFFKDTRIVTDTIREVAARLTVPLVLFFLLASMFGGLLYYVEGGLLYRCEDWSRPSTQPGSAPSAGENGTAPNCKLCGGPPLIVPFGNPLASLNPGMPTYTLDWSDEWLGHEEWYNSTCRFLHEAVGNSGTSGVGSVKALQTPLIIDAFDGLWCIIVTMTTVGYGGKRPHTPAGKSVVVIAALFGAFYLAMPLSIIATAFNKNYLIRLEQEDKANARRKRQAMMALGKLKFMHIVKLKLWAKRSVERAKGHAHGSGRIAGPQTQVLRYVEALHMLANNHRYSELQEFKKLHHLLMENVFAGMCRHMLGSIQYTRGAVFTDQRVD